MKTIENRRNKSMKMIKDIQITIKPIAGRRGEYIASYSSEFLDATFSVYFKDNILGAIALQSFAEMIKLKYEKERIEFVLSEEWMQFKSRDLFEVMTGSRLQK